MLRMYWDPPWDRQVSTTEVDDLYYHATSLFALPFVRRWGLVPSRPGENSAGIGKTEWVVYAGCQRVGILPYSWAALLPSEGSSQDKSIRVLLGIRGTVVPGGVPNHSKRDNPQYVYMPGSYHIVTVEFVCEAGMKEVQRTENLPQRGGEEP